MKLASEFISQEDRTEIEAAIAEAESKTSGEIVPVVATASGRYDRAEDVFGMLVALLALSLSWVFLQRVLPAQGDWAAGQTLVLGLGPILIIIVAGFALGSAAAAYFPVFRLPFITKKEMREEVERSAAEAFHRFRVRKTEAGTGILIYVSLYERMVRVQGDDTISAKMDQSDWDAVLDTVIDSLKADRASQGIAQGILKSGELLSHHFPIQPGDVNEIGNDLRIID